MASAELASSVSIQIHLNIFPDCCTKTVGTLNVSTQETSAVYSLCATEADAAAAGELYRSIVQPSLPITNPSGREYILFSW